jgi:hypothetical protein
MSEDTYKFMLSLGLRDSISVIFRKIFNDICDAYHVGQKDEPPKGKKARNRVDPTKKSPRRKAQPSDWIDEELERLRLVEEPSTEDKIEEDYPEWVGGYDRSWQSRFEKDYDWVYEDGKWTYKPKKGYRTGSNSTYRGRGNVTYGKKKKDKDVIETSDLLLGETRRIRQESNAERRKNLVESSRKEEKKDKEEEETKKASGKRRSSW